MVTFSRGFAFRAYGNGLVQTGIGLLLLGTLFVGFGGPQGFGNIRDRFVFL